MHSRHPSIILLHTIFQYGKSVSCTVRPGTSKEGFRDLTVYRESELKQLAIDIGYPTTGTDWQEKVLLFCLDVNSCFVDLSKDKMDEDEIHKCMTLIRFMTKNRPLIEMQKIQDLAYNIAEDFKSLYAKQD
jgi:hypothetical protein